MQHLFIVYRVKVWIINFMLVCCVLLFFDCLETLVLGHAKTLIKLIFSDGALLTLEGARLTHAWEMNIFGNLTLLIHLN